MTHSYRTAATYNKKHYTDISNRSSGELTWSQSPICTPSNISSMLPSLQQPNVSSLPQQSSYDPQDSAFSSWQSEPVWNCRGSTKDPVPWSCARSPRRLLGG